MGIKLLIILLVTKMDTRLIVGIVKRSIDFHISNFNTTNKSLFYFKFINLLFKFKFIKFHSTRMNYKQGGQWIKQNVQIQIHMFEHFFVCSQGYWYNEPTTVLQMAIDHIFQILVDSRQFTDEEDLQTTDFSYQVL